MITKTDRILLTFIGTVDPNCIWTTVGDVMALYNVAKRLHEIVEGIEIAWTGDLFDLSSSCLPPKVAVQRSYSAVVYVCGPLHQGLRPLFSRFPDSKHIAVGVSIPTNSDPNSIVDAWFARDSAAVDSFDLALADVGYPHLSAPRALRTKRLAICLVGPQQEYGQDDGHALARNLLSSAEFEVPLITVNTLLKKDRPIPVSVELDLQSAMAIVTTRMHASLLAIFHDVPLLAIDQIRGGAKVTRMLEKIGHPVFNAWSTKPKDISEEISRIMNPLRNEARRRSKENIIKCSRQALDNAVSFICQEVV